jgi:hypothetical protein
MDARYWYQRRAEANEAASHCANRHRQKEPSDEFRFPPANIRDALKAIFRTEIAEPDLVWLSSLLDCILRFENGSLLENYLDRTPNPTDYRLAAEKLMRVLYAMDEVMVRSGPSRDWQQISLALGLPSSRYLRLTEAAIGRQFNLSTMAISKSISKLLRLAELKPHGRGYNGFLTSL